MDQSQTINIKASDQALQGLYTNAMQVTHTREEVILDFLSIVPPQGQLLARIITSPGHAKRIMAALEDNLKKYESQFGAIAPAAGPSEEFGFTVPKA